jgi:hypothetical protein
LSGVAGGLVAGVIGQLIADHRDLVVASSGKTELSEVAFVVLLLVLCIAAAFMRQLCKGFAP